MCEMYENRQTDSEMDIWRVSKECNFKFYLPIISLKWPFNDIIQKKKNAKKEKYCIVLQIYF
jgi:hypothetical protein